MAGSCAYGNEYLDSIKWEEFIDWLRTCGTYGEEERCIQDFGGEA